MMDHNEATVLSSIDDADIGVMRTGGGVTSAATSHVAADDKSPILMTGARYLLPLLLAFAAFLLIRGHNEPGGGFVAGLVTAAAIALYAMAMGEEHVRRVFPFDFMRLIGVGLAVALASGLLAVANRQEFLTGLWNGASIPVLGKLGTPFVFDVGVFLVVTGIVVKILMTLLQFDAEEAQETH